MPVSRSHFEEELKRIRHNILEMGSRVEDDIHKAMDAFRLGDESLSAAVKADDPVINALQTKIEDQAAALIATQQPVAGDLRELVAAIKLVDHLERIGDYAVHMAKAALKIRSGAWLVQSEKLLAMAEIGCGMLKSAMDSYLEHDGKAARACAARDEEIDLLNKELVKTIFERVQAETNLAAEAVKLTRLSAFLERLGDHVTSICELVIYMKEGAHEELNG